VPVFLTLFLKDVTIYNMPFCHAPWTNLDIDSQGKILPCCKYQPSSDDLEYNIRIHSLNEYSTSAFLNQIKQKFIQDQWPAGCVRCQIEEQNNIQSKRQLDHDRWQDHYSQYQLDSDQWLTACIAFGNTCNLKCITCSSHSSSRWRDEYNVIYGQDFQHVKFYRNDFVEIFVAQAPGIVHIDVHGGEPFLSGVDEQKKLLQHYVDSGRAADITLHYITNVSTFPDEDWWQLWSNFREVDLQLSIDGIESRYEYIRYPAVWTVTLENTQRYIQKEKQLANVRLSVSHTVSAYNIFYLDEFFTWCANIGLPKPWLGRVHGPAHMRPSVWPNTQYIIDHLFQSQYEDVRTWAGMINNSDDSDQFEEFCKKLHQHDRYRGLDFAQTFPEMAHALLPIE
jgi:MoaA/NifB/PqqE/SkfB family radical SAM enzyme